MKKIYYLALIILKAYFYKRLVLIIYFYTKKNNFPLMRYFIEGIMKTKTWKIYF